ncbi:SusD/RagB family nutrient-binding outer membrane lipoprotein [Dyadobacter psychrotolerans]|uniref:SusD/RagB family nutrient-binding outer membrane lipoprotein n=1 Tax=Dyadobacter psychrotolerans TaxID=2541721 RepID=A0A4R5DPS0_9BACT|nr:SusD/RagB family nutrient-binding outer membrane lipoprotein [Dyadobacter psychrotolerans]TDE12773.1 SusD/RagB family nutrient-binding outer membrane lipoprotein [Dyadobacter psychrotolerans]
MKKFSYKVITLSLSLLFMLGACKDLDDLNVNPNSPSPETTDLNLLLPTVITSLGSQIVDLGFGDLAGVMQHMQKTGWQGGFNAYDWASPGQSWTGYYGILRNADELHKKAVKDGFKYHEGVALIMKAYTFGLIADLWGDAPYTEALRAEEGSKYFKPVFDKQQDIYHGILAELETANTLLSQEGGKPINATQDVLFAGNVAKWRKFANSLALRYYMRLQAKEQAYAKAGIVKIASDPAKYPLITSAADDANVSYPGTANAAWPTNMVFNNSPDGEYMRRKPASILVEALKSLKDPRIAVWFDKVPQPLVLVPGTNVSRASADGKTWEISADKAKNYETTYNTPLNYSTDYIGIPPAIGGAMFYNLQMEGGVSGQGRYNPHISQINSMYKNAAGDLLKMRLISAAEVNFILAEAASYTWITGAETYYAKGIQESFNAWGVGAAFTSYIAGASYNGLQSIMQQKWIASWSAAAEAWFDWRRTGLPALNAGPSAARSVLPLRFYYSLDDDLNTNTDNAKAAIANLVRTSYAGSDPTNNSAWSKTWLLEGTGKPY